MGLFFLENYFFKVNIFDVFGIFFILVEYIFFDIGGYFEIKVVYLG